MSELPTGWTPAVLGDVITVRRDKKDPRQLPNLPFIGLEEVEAHTGRIISTQNTSALKSAVALFDKGDVLYGRLRPYLNKVVVPDFGGAASAEFIVFPRSEILEPHFLQRVLMSPDFISFAVLKSTGDRPRVSYESLSAYEFSIPPIGEQQRIVAKVDSLSAKSKRARDQLDYIPRLVEKYKQVILAAAFRGDLTLEWRKDHHQSISTEQLEALRKSAWQGLREVGRISERYSSAESIDWQPPIDLPAGWTWASLDQIACLVQYGSSAKTTENQRGVAVLRMGNIQAGKLDLSSLKFLPEDHEEFPDLLLDHGDVLFNRTNSAELVGKSAVYVGEPKKASFASYLIRVRCSGLLPELLSDYINSAYGRGWVASVVSQQVGQANVNGTKLRQLGIPVMPVEEQSEIARRIAIAFAWVDRLSSETTSARKLIDHLDQAVLAKAFRGELVPQDPNDEPASILLVRVKAERQAAPCREKQKNPPQVRTRALRRH
jgi:type I restriction enzyme S subunit